MASIPRSVRKPINSRLCDSPLGRWTFWRGQGRTSLQNLFCRITLTSLTGVYKFGALSGPCCTAPLVAQSWVRRRLGGGSSGSLVAWLPWSSHQLPVLDACSVGKTLCERNKTAHCACLLTDKFQPMRSHFIRCWFSRHQVVFESPCNGPHLVAAFRDTTANDPSTRSGSGNGIHIDRIPGLCIDNVSPLQSTPSAWSALYGFDFLPKTERNRQSVFVPRFLRGTYMLPILSASG